MSRRAWSRSVNHCALRHSSRNFPLKLSMKAFSVGLPGRMKWSFTFAVKAHWSSALLGDHLFQSTIFVLEVLEPLGVAHVHAAELRLPPVEGLLRHAQSAADLGGLGAGVDLLQGPDDLLFGELRLPAHVSSATALEDSHFNWSSFRGAGQT